jgi:hypothetical protein
VGPLTDDRGRCRPAGRAGRGIAAHGHGGLPAGPVAGGRDRLPRGAGHRRGLGRPSRRGVGLTEPGLGRHHAG